MTTLSPAGRYLRTAAIVALASIAAVVSINLAAFRLMLAPGNAAVAELVDGWSRLYKPILYDAERPRVAIFGRSFVRDAFDPEEISKLIGKRTFNFAVSGGTPYENRRFAQSAFSNPDLEAIVLNLDSFYASQGSPRYFYGFDESVLNINPDGTPNRLAWLNRALAVTLTGAAIGNNAQLVGILMKISAGATKQDVVPSYQRRDNTKPEVAAAHAQTKARIFRASPGSMALPIALPASTTTSGLPEFDKVVDLYCSRDVDVYVYMEAGSDGACGQPLSRRLDAFAYLKQRKGSCRARLHFFDFQYPNAVSLEGVATPVAHSVYYRPDGHPRPTTGMLMASVFFGVPFPSGTPAAVTTDFGTDLLANSDPLGWWQRRLDRCVGRWTDDDALRIVGRSLAD